MKWLAIGLALAACAVFGLIGLMVGIWLNPESTMRFVPNLGSLGDWVSGVGALAALGFAMRQFYIQRESDRIFTSLLEKVAEKFWRVRLVSEGFIPVTVLGAELRIGGAVIDLPNFFRGQSGFAVPMKLERGDVQQIIAVDSINFNLFSGFVMENVFSALNEKGLRPLKMNYGLNEEYFSELQALLAAGLLVVKLAHDDILQPIPEYILDQISRPLISMARERAIEEDKSRREDLQATFEMIQRNNE